MKEFSSRVLDYAMAIYHIWYYQGVVELVDYFTESLGIPKDRAELLARSYKPKGEPEVLAHNGHRTLLESKTVFSALQLSLDGHWPKNELAFWIIRNVFGKHLLDFDVLKDHQIRGEHCLHLQNRLSDSSGHVVRMGLAAISDGKLASVPNHVVRKSVNFTNELGPDIGMSLAQKMVAAGLIFPPKGLCEMLCQVIKRGLSGETINLVSLVCPDYAYESTGRDDVPYRYTFDNVGEGVGLVAQQVVRALPFLVTFFREHGIAHKVTIGIGDFEANSPEILDSVGIDREEFIRRCFCSLDAIRAQFPLVPVELLLFEAGWANGRWQPYISQSYADMKAKKVSNIEACTGKDFAAEVWFIAESCRDFYERWYSRSFSDNELYDLVLRQGSEYAAAGKIIEEDLVGQPVIQVAGDRPKMQIFNYLHASFPVLCTQRVY